MKYPESSYAVEIGLKLRTDRVAASVRLFDHELRDLLQRRTAIFGSPVVGLVVAGHEIVRQDAAGRVFVAADPRPIVTRVNVQRARIWGVETDLSWSNRNWGGRAHFSMASGRESQTGEFLRRMPPPFGGVRVRWRPPASRVWLEVGATFAMAQRRLSPGDLADARIGALRTRDAIAEFFGGRAAGTTDGTGPASMRQAPASSYGQVTSSDTNESGVSSQETGEAGWLRRYLLQFGIEGGRESRGFAVFVHNASGNADDTPGADRGYVGSARVHTARHSVGGRGVHHRRPSCRTGRGSPDPRQGHRRATPDRA